MPPLPRRLSRHALPEACRDPLMLTAGGVGYDEIGRMLGLQPGTVKVRVHRADYGQH